ncbi:2-hydroxyacid dehydrogenase [Cognatishimia maritima]|uniref:Glyoxylate reductase n=1 Tax=Cognatishimia maritima TaxID=870908 RepID=A0A1M5UVV6_9RHOB|nr:D-glycerate dehydrogenase [Cognatishimia maritima]SHH66843.1 glyoxylate reductase [Cognatishimia maritima]
MAKQRLSVVVTRRLPEPVETRLAELFDVTLRDDDTQMSREDLLQTVQTANVLVTNLNDRIDSEVIAACGPQLKLIANYGAGVDHIEVEEARAKGITVTNTPGVMTEDTADMAMALVLAVTRRIPEGLAQMERGKWEGWSPSAMLGGRIRGRKLGILGLGRIGRALAHRARAFGMEIHYHNRRRVHPGIEEQLQATYWESLDQMLARMDVLSINCPHTPATYHLVNARRLKLMKPDAVIVNTSRGEVVDEAALARALKAQEIGGAGLDVYEGGEEMAAELRSLGNVVMLPHMGSATLEGRIEMGEKVMLNIRTFEDGHRPPDVVLPEML